MLVNVENDIPTVKTGASLTIAVQEDALGNTTANAKNDSADSDLSTGNLEGGALSTQTDRDTFTTTDLQNLVNPGADEPVAFAFKGAAALTDATAVRDSSNAQITSGGKAVFWHVVDASHVLGYADVNGNSNFDALTFAAPDVGYGPVIFYYLRHDSAGVSTFGTITPGGAVGVVADLFVVGNNFDALTFSGTDVGYGANMFYYLRHDNTGHSFFGTINPALPGTITDRFPVGTNFDALAFTATDVGYGANLFYYLRHDVNGLR